MSPRSRVTFSKRQKEQARQEKQRAKAERKAQRRLESRSPAPPDDAGVSEESAAQPEPSAAENHHFDQ